MTKDKIFREIMKYAPECEIEFLSTCKIDYESQFEENMKEPLVAPDLTDVIVLRLIKSKEPLDGDPMQEEYDALEMEDRAMYERVTNSSRENLPMYQDGQKMEHKVEEYYCEDIPKSF
jgi:hypothetical protein